MIAGVAFALVGQYLQHSSAEEEEEDFGMRWRANKADHMRHTAAMTTCPSGLSRRPCPLLTSDCRMSSTCQGYKAEVGYGEGRGLRGVAGGCRGLQGVAGGRSMTSGTTASWRHLDCVHF